MQYSHDNCSIYHANETDIGFLTLVRLKNVSFQEIYLHPSDKALIKRGFHRYWINFMSSDYYSGLCSN